MSIATRNARGETDILIPFNDGLHYKKSQMQQVFSTGILDKVQPKAVKETFVGNNPKDVDFILNELEIPRVQAERVLAQEGGDLGRALRVLAVVGSTAAA